jgi:hypothetical protein
VGAYSPVQVPFINGGLSVSELNARTSVCSFIQSNDTGYQHLQFPPDWHIERDEAMSAGPCV